MQTFAPVTMVTGVMVEAGDCVAANFADFTTMRSLRFFSRNRAIKLASTKDNSKKPSQNGQDMLVFT